MNKLAYIGIVELLDFDKISLSPDMFNPTTLNVFFVDEEIGSIEESRDKWIARPSGTTAMMGAYCKEGAIKLAEHIAQRQNDDRA